MMDQKTLGVQKVYSTVVSFAMQQNHVPVIRQLVLQNNTDAELREIHVDIVSQPEFAVPYHTTLDAIPAGQAVNLGSIDLQLSASYLADTTEKVSGTLSLEASQNGSLLYEETLNIDVLAFDQWSGNATIPEMIAAFVTPNHPEITKVVKKASAILGDWTGDPSLDAYQTNDPNRVRQQVAAVYAALQAQNITYCVPPASFETSGQRIRLCDALLSQKLGTCLDLTLLYASCLEAIGIHPIVIILQDHSFLGAWLTDESFPECVQDDGTLLTKRTADGENSICVVETTALTAGKEISFEEAERHAGSHFAEPEKFVYFVDVERARASGIKPLPLRIATENGFVFQDQNEKPIVTASQAPADINVLSPLKDVEHISVSKKELWERKLLDLSLRNNLLNFRPNKNTIRILSYHPDAIEDVLASGEDFQILERPSDWEDTIRDAKLFELHTNLSPMEPLLQREFEFKRLRSDLSSNELNNGLKSLYRKSRDALEENGANVLYLALGFLRWYDTGTSQKPLYAPVVLIPVEIVKKSAKFGYVIRERDDDPQMNITLLELLKRDFGISIDGLDPLPSDGHGVNIRMVFHILRQAVLSKPRWDICEDACLDIFSFSRFVMWNDIHARSEDLSKNKIVKSLMSGKLEFEQEPLLPDHKNLDEICLPQGLLLSTNADASQLGAVYAASEGKSFVLHGPPGTGKSQTITNLISNALAQGKTVLFVAEKMAALSVVQKRLEQLGLSPFCLELHSNKATKKAVLEQLRVATEVAKITQPEEFSLEAGRLQQQREELNEYSRALYEKKPYGITLYDAMSRFFQYEGAKDTFNFDSSVFSDMTADKLRSWEDKASELSVAGAETGHPCNHPLAEIKVENYSQELREKADQVLRALAGNATECDRLAIQFQELLKIEAPFSTLQEYKLLLDLSKLVSEGSHASNVLINANDISPVISKLRLTSEHGLKEQQIRGNLLGRFDQSILLFDGIGTLHEWQSLEVKWFLPKTLGQNRILKLLRTIQNGGAPLQKQEVPSLLSIINSYQAEKAEVESSSAETIPLTIDYWKEFDTDWNRVLESCNFAENVNSCLTSLTHDSKKVLQARQAVSEVLAAGHGVDTMRSYEASLFRMFHSMNEAGKLLVIDFNEINNKTGRFVSIVSQKSTEWVEHINGMRDWCGWNRVKKQAEESGLAPLVNTYENGMIANDEVVSAFQRALYKACASHILSHEKSLTGFSGSMFEEKIRRFRNTTDTLESLSRRETFARIAAKIPNFTQEAAQSSEVGILKRAIRSNGRGMSIRNLFGQIPRLLPRLCPCMLMSPMSVAQYLDPHFKMFDLVVFDEASQMPTSEAVGAIARGENAVIVGDPKQLPPTSFFMTNSTDDDHFESEDLDSILDDCLALSMPEMHLLWHYRSRHESLITFSNIEYYQNQLLTFPSPNNLISRVTLVPVDGFYDRGKSKQNRAEAEAVVADIMQRLENPETSRYSIGVVTFSSVQQNLIDDLLSDAFREQPELEEVAQKCHEPIFIKNLENVQGDERDVILFSVGYGPDQEGRVCHNFGPLNQSGGWRRLNVAVSRARNEMTVYSALKPEQLDLSRTSSEGVAGLKAFLEFAQKGHNTIAYRDIESHKNDSGLNEQIAKRLSASGLAAHTNVGSSNYKIDVAIVNPKKNDEYILGILCNGQPYRVAQTARDREILQHTVLNQLGWNLHNIWAIDWWDDQEKEIQKIKEKVVRLMASPQKTGFKIETVSPKAQIASSTITKKKEIASVSNSETVKQKYIVTHLPYSNISSDEFCLPYNAQRILERISKVVESEGPVSRSLICKRVLQSFGIAKMGSRLEQRFGELFRKLHYPTYVHHGIRFYWPMNTLPSSYMIFRVSENEDERRSADDLPPEEVACAVRCVLQNQLSMTKMDLVRETYKVFGYTRTGSAVEQAMETGIDYAIKSKSIELDNDGVASII